MTSHISSQYLTLAEVEKGTLINSFLNDADLLDHRLITTRRGRRCLRRRPAASAAAVVSAVAGAAARGGAVGEVGDEDDVEQEPNETRLTSQATLQVATLHVATLQSATPDDIALLK